MKPRKRAADGRKWRTWKMEQEETDSRKLMDKNTERCPGC